MFHGRLLYGMNIFIEVKLIRASKTSAHGFNSMMNRNRAFFQSKALSVPPVRNILSHSENMNWIF